MRLGAWSWRHTLVLLAVLVVFGRTTTHEFTFWDDDFTIAHNPAFNPATARSLAFYWTNHENGLYYPVTNTLWWLLTFVSRVDVPDERGAALNPWLYHATNVCIHAATSLVVLSILRRLLRNDRAALLATLLFALHPLQVETVAWASGTKDLLGWMFAAVSLRLYLAFLDAGETRARRRCWVSAMVLAALAMLSKPTPLVLPLMWMAVDRIVAGREWKRVLRSALPGVLLLTIPTAVIGAIAQPAMPVDDVPLWQRPIVAGDALAFYLGKLLWPTALGIDHARRPDWLLTHGWAFLTPLIPLAIAAWLYVLRRREPLMLLGGVIALFAVAPVLGLKKFLFQYYSTVADHYTYFWLFGIALIAGVLLRRFTSTVVTASTSAALAALAACAIVQAGHWQSDFTLFPHTIAVSPRSSSAHNNFGAALLSRGAIPAAVEQFREAARLAPDSAVIHFNYADVLVTSGDNAAALRELRESIRISMARPDRATPEGLANQLGDASRVAFEAGDEALAEQYARDSIARGTGLPEAKRTLVRLAAKRASTMPAP